MGHEAAKQDGDQGDALNPELELQVAASESLDDVLVVQCEAGDDDSLLCLTSLADRSRGAWREER
jgi:hypothetical protein